MYWKYRNPSQDLERIKNEFAKDGRPLDYLCDIADIEKAINSGESNEKVYEMIYGLLKQN
jgi:hypothetical protein